MPALLKFIDSTNSSKDLDQLFAVFSATVQDMGYDRSIFSLMTDHAELKLNAGHGIMRNYPDAWMKHYVERGMEKYDPVRCFMFRANGPFLWDELPMVMHYSPLQRSVMDGGHEAGLRSGVGVSMRNMRGEIAGVGAANSTGQPLDPRAPYLLNMYSQHLYFRFSELQTGGEPAAAIQITDREREILSWLAIGKNLPDIAEIVGLTHRGVRYHMARILDKLSVPNQTSAITKALRSGLISP